MIWRFKDHVYGRDPLNEKDTLDHIKAGDLTAFSQRYFTPANMVLAVAGDIDQKAMVRDINAFLARLPRTEAPPRQITSPDDTPAVLAVIDRPGQVQSQVVISLASVPRSHPDYWPLHFLTSIMGGQDSLMYTRLRDELGLVYSAGFYQTYRWHAGILLGFIGCKANRTTEAISETLAIMQELQQSISDEVIEQKRLDALNSFIFNVDNPSELVEVYGRYYLRGEPLDTLEQIQQAYLQTSKADLLRLAQRYLRPEAVQIFVTADASTPIEGEKQTTTTLADALKQMGTQRGLPFEEIALR
jgi:zinc protease